MAMRRFRTTAICAACLGLSAPAAAAGDGGPMPPAQGGSGVSASAGGDVGYVAVGVGNGRTLVQRIRRGPGAVERTRVIAGRFGVGAIAFDGSATGLSADGRTLVLAGMVGRRWPIRSTRLAVLDARPLRLRGHVDLRGYWTLDAIAPDGRRLYLLHYLSPRNLQHYEVRAYDLPGRRLVAKPVVDPREPDEKMEGMALTRSMSRDGRWAYTLYLRPSGGPPFIHALDTVEGTARCIDLPAALSSADLSSARLILSGDGRSLSISGPGAPVLVDTSTFTVSHPPAVPSARTRRAPEPNDRDGGTGTAWTWALGALPLLAVPAAATARRRRRARRPHLAG
jgi:hypothetical protein